MWWFRAGARYHPHPDPLPQGGRGSRAESPRPLKRERDRSFYSHPRPLKGERDAEAWRAAARLSRSWVRGCSEGKNLNRKSAKTGNSRLITGPARLLAAAGLPFLMPFVAACGFQPIYGGSGPSGVRAELAAIEVGLIKDRVGQQLRNELVQRLHPDGRPRKPAYRLHIDLSIDKRDLALKKSEIATRANLQIRATYSLRNNPDGKMLIQGTARITTSYDILRSDFATLAAEADARRRGVRELADEITNRLAVFLQTSPKG